MVKVNRLTGRILFLVAALLVLTSLAAYGVHAAQTGKEVPVDINANGSTVKVKPGDVLVISLEATPGTGYSWAVLEPGTAVEQVGGGGAGDESEFQGRVVAPSNLLGGSSTQVMRLKVVQAGEFTLKLGYVRPWEKGVAPEATFSLNVVVQ